MRPKKCNCGGRKPTYQMAGYYPHENYYEPVSADLGVHNPGFNPADVQLANGPKGISYAAPQQRNKFDAFDLGLGIQAGTDILSEISGRMERGRQNQYMYNQYSTLGQMNGMPTQDYQPNPYNLYAKYGGSLKRYMNYDSKFSNDAHFGTGDETMHGSMQTGGYSPYKDHIPVEENYVQVKTPNPFSRDFVQFMLSGPYNKTNTSSNGVPFPVSTPQTFSGNLPAVNIPKQAGGISDPYFAQNFGQRHNIPILAQSGYSIGNPKFVDQYGKPYVAPPVKPLAFNIPNDIKAGDIQSYGNQYWYNDPHTGDVVDVDPSIVNLPRFKNPTNIVPPGMSSSIATIRQTGGITRGLIPTPTYKFPPDYQPTRLDSFNYKEAVSNAYSKPQYFQQHYVAPTAGLIVDSQTPEQTKTWVNYMGMLGNAQADAEAVMTPQQVQTELQRPLIMPQDMIRRKSKYSGGGGLSRGQDYGSSKKPYPSVSSGQFAGPHRSYPIPTHADAVDAMRLASLHGADDVKAKIKARYPDLKKGGKMKKHVSPQQQRMAAMMQQRQQMMGQRPGMQANDNDGDEMAKGGNWIQGAINPAHKGYCTPMTKSTCTGHRRALALMFKKKHGFHKGK